MPEAFAGIDGRGTRRVLRDLYERWPGGGPAARLIAGALAAALDAAHAGGEAFHRAVMGAVGPAPVAGTFGKRCEAGGVLAK